MILRPTHDEDLPRDDLTHDQARKALRAVKRAQGYLATSTPGKAWRLFLALERFLYSRSPYGRPEQTSEEVA